MKEGDSRCNKLTLYACAGIDTGVFLIRNHPFIRELMNTLEKKARVLPLLSKVCQHQRRFWKKLLSAVLRAPCTLQAACTDSWWGVAVSQFGF